jgi:hypothetical protein
MRQVWAADIVFVERTQRVVQADAELLKQPDVCASPHPAPHSSEVRSSDQRT